MFFCSCPSFLDKPREETLATQATVAQRALRDPQSMFVHRGVHRSWPSLLKIDFFLFSTRLGDFSIFEVTVVLSLA